MACRILKEPHKYDSSSDKLVVIGDVHGSLSGLSTILYHANITVSKDACDWNPASINTVVIQVGDIVDRGPAALESWQCLERLQQENVPKGSKVVRMIGNHELWWLEGRFHHRNPKTE